MKLRCGNCSSLMRHHYAKSSTMGFFIICSDDDCTNRQQILVQLANQEEAQYIEVEF